MPDVSKLWCRAYWLLPTALLAGALVVVAVGQRPGRPATQDVPLDDWDIPQLVAYLNGEGLGLRLASVQKDGGIQHTAFLTTTDREWIDLNELPKIRNQINRWQGTLYCERGPAEDWSERTLLWGDCCLVGGPFLFYGDRELLDRVRAALVARKQWEDRLPSPATWLGYHGIDVIRTCKRERVQGGRGGVFGAPVQRPAPETNQRRRESFHTLSSV
jgi:hypothetical protein